MLPDVLSVVARALSFIGALQAAGVAIFLALFETPNAEIRGRIRRLGMWSGWTAIGLIGVHYGLEPARMAGDLAGVADLSLQKLAATTGVGIAAAMRVAGLLLVMLALKRGDGGAGDAVGQAVPYSAAARAPLRTPAWVGVLLIAASFAATGHTAGAEAHRWLLAALLVIHVLVIEFWFGALLPLIVASREPSALAARTVRRFSRIATALVPLILLAGLGMAWLLVPGLEVFREPYGQLLLAKVFGFALLLAFAALNKWKLAPDLETRDLNATRRFRRSVYAEYVLIGAVLAITAVMTSLFSPES